MGKAPAFQFYAADFVIGTMGLPLEVLGAYIRLLALSWDRGPVPKDEDERAAWMGVPVKQMRPIWERLSAKWIETDDGFINDRLEEQRAEREAFVAAQSEKGKRGARRRWDGSGHAPAIAPAIVRPIPNACPVDGSSSSVFDLRSSDPKHTQSVTETAPLIDGRSIRLHAQHAWCSLPREGLCVPPFLHAEFLGKSQRSDAELRRWYRDIVAQFDGVGIGEDSLTFWRNQFALWVGTVTSKPGRGDKTTRALDAVEEAIRLSQLDQKAVGDGRG